MKDRLRLVIAEAVAVLLAASALWPVFEEDGWVVPVVLTVLLVLGAAEGLRRIGLPRVLVPLGSLAVLLVWLVATQARESAPFGLLPSPDAMGALRSLTEAGFRDINDYAAPVPVTDGLLVLTLAALGLVAIAVDAVVVLLRRPAPAGLALLGVYAVPGAVAPDGVPWLAFALGAIGYLGLLLAESRDRVGRWGRLLSGKRSRVSSPLSSAGRRVGGTALAVAVVIPALAPGLDGQVLRFGSGGNGSGTGTRVGGDPLVNLQRDLARREKVEVFTISVPQQSAGGIPGAAAAALPYMRTEVFDQLDGTTWRHARPEADLTSSDGVIRTPAWGDPEALSRNVRVKTTDEFRLAYLPVPYGTLEVSGLDGDWSADTTSLEIFGQGRRNASDMEYSLVQADPSPQPSALREARVGTPGARYLDAGSLVDSRIVAQALDEAVPDDVRRQGPYAKALALQNWLSTAGGFTYTTDAPQVEDQEDLIEQFVLDKQGFCVHYASAMVLMARLLDIPARMAVGYLPGQPRNENGQTIFTVTTLESHAWPELYFEGFGWLRFEPTPRTDATTDRPLYADGANLEEVDPETGQDETAEPSVSASASASASASRIDRGDAPELDDDVAAAASGRDWSRPVSLLVGAFVLVALLLLPALFRRRLRASRLAARAGTPAAVAGLWDEIADVAVDLGLGSGSRAQTPRQWAGRLTILSGYDVHEGPLARLLNAYERARFAAPGSAGPDVSGDARMVSEALYAAAGSTDRFRARWVPRSTWAAFRRTVGAAWVTVSGWPSAVGARLLPSR